MFQENCPICRRLNSPPHDVCDHYFHTASVGENANYSGTPDGDKLQQGLEELRKLCINSSDQWLRSRPYYYFNSLYHHLGGIRWKHGPTRRQASLGGKEIYSTYLDTKNRRRMRQVIANIWGDIELATSPISEREKERIRRDRGYAFLMKVSVDGNRLLETPKIQPAKSNPAKHKPGRPLAKEEMKPDTDEVRHDEGACPICSEAKGCKHLLANFNVDVDGDGNFGMGLGGGPLFEMTELETLFDLVRTAWAEPMFETGAGKMPGWVKKRSALHAYWRALNEADVDREAHEDADEFLWDVQANLSQEGEELRAIVEKLISETKSTFQATECEIEEGSGLWSYRSWWAKDPEGVVTRLKRVVNEIITDAKKGG